MGEAVSLRGTAPVRWAKVIDQTRCIGCHACTTACKSENEVPLGVDSHVRQVRRRRRLPAGAARVPGHALQPVRRRAVRHRVPDGGDVSAAPDGIVDFDKQVCIGCKACIAACPYDAIFINPEDHSAEKCNFCAHRLDVGLEPACVVVCPIEAILVGDLNDPALAGRADRRSATPWPCAGPRRRRGRSSSTRARTRRRSTRSPRAGRTAACSCGASSRAAGSRSSPGIRALRTRSAAALLAYDVPHRAPWDWRVSLYTWTKGIAAGAYLVPLLLLLAGRVASAGELALALGGAGRRGSAFLAVTGGILIWRSRAPGAASTASSRGRSGGAGSCAARS